MEIRPLTPDDWESLRTLRLAALADSPDAFGSTLAAAERQPERLWRERLAGPGATFGAYDDAALVAMAGGYPLLDRPDAAVVWGMWTAPAARGRGIGRALLLAAVAWCRSQGRPSVSLHVTEGNDAARRLYESAGFVATGEWEPLREGSPLRIERLTLRRG